LKWTFGFPITGVGEAVGVMFNQGLLLEGWEEYSHQALQQ
jgi:hypothetical protein